MADLDPAERRCRGTRSQRRVDGEAVVVGGDLDLAGGPVHDRLVDAPVAVAELVGAEAERPTQDLVAEADAEDRDPRGQRRPASAPPRGRPWPGRPGRWRRRRRPAPRWRATRATSRPAVIVAGSTCTVDPALGHPARGHGLDAQVDRRARWRRCSPRRPTTYASAVVTSAVRSAPAIGGLARTSACRSVERAGGRRAGEDPDAHRAPLAQVPGERAGVDAADADDSVRAQLVVEGPPAPASCDGRRRRVAHDVAGDPDPPGLRVLVVDAGVADVRRGLHHDLPVVGGIGQRLLVAGHPGGEDRLAEGGADGAVGLPAERPAVLEDEHSRGGRLVRVIGCPPAMRTSAASDRRRPPRARRARRRGTRSRPRARQLPR